MATLFGMTISNKLLGRWEEFLKYLDPDERTLLNGLHQAQQSRYLYRLKATDSLEETADQFRRNYGWCIKKTKPNP